MTVQHLIVRALKWAGLLLTPSGPRGSCPGASASRTPASPTRRAGVRRRTHNDDFFEPLIGEEHDLVRPYVVLYEREQERRRQEQRKHALRMPLVGAGSVSRTSSGPGVTP